jgi:chromatin structure-remodeling complex subunit RSC9
VKAPLNTRVFAAHFLETGMANRLTLSLASGRPEDVDFALDRLLVTTFHEPDLLSLDRFPGLLDVLLATIRLHVERPSIRPLSSLFADGRRRDTRRRALEAALVARNFATQSVNQSSFRNNSRVLHLLLDSLDRQSSFPTTADPDAELLIYLLEIVEILGPSIELSPNPPQSPSDGDGDDAASADREALQVAFQEAAAATARGTRLFTSIANLTSSPDRGLVLAAYRALSALGSGVLNRAFVGSLSTDGNGLASSPIEKALELLALDDVDLLFPILDFLCTASSANAVSAALCVRPDLGAALKLLLVHAKHRLSVQALPTVMLDWESADWRWTNKAARDVTAKRKAKEAETLESFERVPFDTNRTLLSANDLTEIVNIPEPRRTLMWMRYVFEADPEAEIQQVDLWFAYRTQFQDYQDKVPITAASEVIKMSTDAFPDALPMVVERAKDKMFVIRGIKVRDRSGALLCRS